MKETGIYGNHKTIMNEESYKLAALLLDSCTYSDQGRDAKRTHEKQIQSLIQHRKLPDDGWSDARIKLFVNELSLMDSNNFPGNIGVGEREARIASRLVQERHFGFGHGIGRSGDVTAVQPKAAGSSLLNQLTNSLLLDVIQKAGVHSTKACVLLPVATGMALLMVLLTLKQERPTARFVIWPRIDQKSCFKCIPSAGFEPVIIQNLLEGDELRTDVAAIEKVILEKEPANILCVMSTTSCFAPRTTERLIDVARICSKYGIPHIVNNAYGVQASRCMNIINEAIRTGRVDAFVQSTDKNFMVPVGGAVVASSNADFIKQVAQTYPGRASSTPSLDVFITLLSLGWSGYKKLLAERKEIYDLVLQKLSKVAEMHNERVLQTPNNPISIAMTLSSISSDNVNWTEFGSMLFVRNVSGTRVVAPGSTKTIAGHKFQNWGSHSNEYPCVYLTVAAAIGMQSEDVDTFCKRLDKTLTKFRKRYDEKSLVKDIPTSLDPKDVKE